MEVREDDKRLNSYVQSLVWRMQVPGDPFREVLRMARSFRDLPMEKKPFVFKHGLRDVDAEKGSRISKKLFLEFPPVQYTTWHVDGEADEDDDLDGQDEKAAP